MRRAGLLVLLICAAAGVAGGAGARADGLPVLGVDVGASGVVSATGDARYVTLPVGARTLVARVDPHGGRVLGTRFLQGSFTIPAVAYDGSADGLSHDGKTLVLIEPRVGFPRTETDFELLSTRGLRPLEVVRLRGDFSFDAISRHGGLMYLVEYTTPTDPSRYLVRAYDLRTGHLLAQPVTDPAEQTTKMRGSPLTRATSPDGRFAYTLYDGAGGTPFVHALDTARAAARCIDLDGLRGSNRLWQLRFHLDPVSHTLVLAAGRETVATIDTRSYRVTTLAAGGPTRVVRSQSHRLVLFAGLALLATSGLLVLAAVLLRQRRAQPTLTSSA